MRCTINFNVQGSKEQEKKKVSFYSRHVGLSRCVGSANFDDILNLVMSCRLKIELLWYECG